MKTIPTPKKGDADKDQTLSEGIQESIHPYKYEVNVTDGGEFLDDAIRMNDQPFEENSIEENQQTKF